MNNRSQESRHERPRAELTRQQAIKVGMRNPKLGLMLDRAARFKMQRQQAASKRVER